MLSMKKLGKLGKLEKLLNPKSIVVIGASENEKKVGNILLKNLTNNKNSDNFAKNIEIFAINPKKGNAYGIKFLQDIADLKYSPDLAIIAIPARFVLNALDQCGKFGIKNVVIISAGFKEMGNLTLENEIIQCGKKYEINILGPNCLGFLNVKSAINASFASDKPVKQGNIALVSQSGAMAVAMMDWANRENIGFSKVVTMGNKSDINENHFLEYLAKDSETDVIVLYLESIVSGKEFFKIAERVSKIKPIVMVKSGISVKGSLAAESHTGALSGKKEILHTALKQAGIRSTHSLQEMFLLSKMFSYFSYKKNIPENIAIITNAGGPAVMAVDNAEIFNVSLVNFSEKEQNILLKEMPKASSCKNPIDILGDATSKRYAQILQNLKDVEQESKKEFAYLVLLTQQSMTDSENIVKEIEKFKKNNPEKTIITSFMGGSDVSSARKMLKEKNILHFDYPREAISAYEKLLIQQNNRSKNTNLKNLEDFKYIKDLENKKFIKNLLISEIKQKRKMCTTQTVSLILKEYNINFAEEFLCTSPEKLRLIWKKITNNGDENNSKIVMKISSPDIPHKTDIGGVILNITSEKEAQNAYQQILKNISNSQNLEKINKDIQIDGVSMQKMLNPNSKEVYVGFTRDAVFGDVIILGFGGIYLNIFSDISRRILPISKKEIHKMLQETKFYALLIGARGEKSVNIENLVSTIFKLSQIFIDNSEISEIDINPIFSSEKENIIIDAKFFL